MENLKKEWKEILSKDPEMKKVGWGEEGDLWIIKHFDYTNTLDEIFAHENNDSVLAKCSFWWELQDRKSQGDQHFGR